MRFLLISQYYTPEPNSGALKVSDIARHLAASGHQVTIVTGFPNFPNGVLYEGYRRSLSRRDTVDGLPVIRTFVTINPRRNKFGPRMMNYVSQMITSVYGGLRAGRHDLVYVYLPPPMMALSGYALSRLFRAPLVLDVNDLWPQEPIQLGLLKNPFLIRMAEAMERFVYDKAAGLFFYSKWMRRAVVESGVPEAKTQLHPLPVDTEVFRPMPEAETAELRKRFGMNGRLIVMYAGNFGLPQGLDTVIECARLFEARGDDTFQFVFVGGGADRERVHALSDKYALRNVLFIPHQPVSTMPLFMSAADILLLHLDRAPFRVGTIPGKLLAYMACARPVLVAIEGEGAEFVREAECGVAVEPQNPAAMAEGLQGLIDPEARRRMGEAGRRLAVARYDRKKLLSELECRMREIASLRSSEPLSGAP